jgi:uncharacterized protein YndB with AHSA1/START domain
MTAQMPIELTRTWKAPLAEVWALWTTKQGLESWWGPQGFRIEVDELDVRVGGKWRYRMIASGENEIAFMKRAGMPVEQHVTATFTVVAPQHTLAIENLVDFVPGQKPYTAGARVELEETKAGVKMTVLVDPMHDAEWTARAKAGWTSQLTKLDARFGAPA